MSAPSILELEPAVMACCDDEIWKPVPDWPHESSTCGQVRSTDRLADDGIWRLGALLPQHPDARPGKGYLYVTLRDGERRRKAPVAVVVLEAHAGPRPGPEYEACHGNDVRTDNHRRNLGWDTRAANQAKMWAARRLRQADTDTAAETPDPCLRGRFPRMRHPASSVPGRVRGNGPHGTVSPPSIPVSPSVPLPVQPRSRTLRTSFRSLRDRLAA